MMIIHRTIMLLLCYVAMAQLLTFILHRNSSEISPSISNLTHYSSRGKTDDNHNIPCSLHLQEVSDFEERNSVYAAAGGGAEARWGSPLYEKQLQTTEL